jgi:uncharacterized membrane protein
LSIGGKLLPLCARCTGIYCGFLAGIICQIIFGKRKAGQLPPLGIIVFSCLFILALIIEAIGERLQLWELSNQGRFLMGLFCGNSISVILFPLFNYFLRKDFIQSSVIEVKHYIGLLVLITLLFGFHYLPATFLIFSFMSIAGLLAIYLFVNMTFSGMVLNWKRKEVNFGNSLLLAGFVLVLFVGEVLVLRGTH